MGTITDGIIDFISETEFSDLPDETVSYAKILLLKNIGAMIAGSVQPATKILSRYLIKQDSVEESGVIGCRFRTSIENAALINGTSGHASELEDDSFPEAVMTYNVIPAVLSVGEALRASGKEIIESFAIGYEIQARLSLHAPGVNERGHSAFSIMGSLGAAAGVAKLLKLNHHEIGMALSVAASHGSGLLRQMGTMCHLFECGLAARNGVVSALLAKEGFTGDPDIIEGPQGLCDVFAGEQHDFKDLIKSLGNPFRIMEVGIKKYPCCYFEQGIIDGVLDLKEKYKLSFDDIELIEIFVSPYFYRYLHYPDPINEDESRFSVQHSLVGLFFEEKLFLDTYTNEKARDPKYQQARRKIKVAPDATREKDWGMSSGLQSKGIIKLKSGKTYEISFGKAKGDPPDYLNEDQVKNIFKDCTVYAGFLSAENLVRISSLVLNLEKVNDIGELLTYLTYGRI